MLRLCQPAQYTQTQISALHILPTVPHHLSTVSILHFTFRILHSAVPHFTNSHYVIGTSQLQAATEERDLRVIVSEDLKWENQC